MFWPKKLWGFSFLCNLGILPTWPGPVNARNATDRSSIVTLPPVLLLLVQPHFLYLPSGSSFFGCFPSTSLVSNPRLPRWIFADLLCYFICFKLFGETYCHQEAVLIICYLTLQSLEITLFVYLLFAWPLFCLFECLLYSAYMHISS